MYRCAYADAKHGSAAVALRHTYIHNIDESKQKNSKVLAIVANTKGDTKLKLAAERHTYIHLLVVLLKVA